MREASAVYLSEGEVFQVGVPYADIGETPRKGNREVTRITVTQDLPGLHFSMERVRVYVGEQMVYEAPLHMVEGVAYKLEDAE